MQLSSKLEFNEYLFCGLSKLVAVFMINVCSSIPSVATSICQIHNVLDGNDGVAIATDIGVNEEGPVLCRGTWLYIAMCL